MPIAYQLRIELRDFKPAIYRDVLVDPVVFFSAHPQPNETSIRKNT